jgi:hypothetical protein
VSELDPCPLSGVLQTQTGQWICNACVMMIRGSLAANWNRGELLADRQCPGALIVDLGLGAVAQSCACFEPSVNPHHERLLGLDAMGSESRAQLLPPPFGEDTGMAHVFAAAIHSAGAKREAQFELLAVTSDILDGQGIVIVRAPLGASVLSEQINPRSTDAVLEGAQGRVFVHGCGECLAARSFCVHP